MKKTALWILGLASLSLGHWAPAAQEAPAFVIITHPENPVTSLSRKQVSGYLLKKTPKWDNGEPVLAVDQGGSDSVRDVFTKEIHGRSLASIKRYWQRQIFSGTDVPPPELPSDNEVVDFVRKNVGAIGYVSRNASLTGVKVVEVTG